MGVITIYKQQVHNGPDFDKGHKIMLPTSESLFKPQIANDEASAFRKPIPPLQKIDPIVSDQCTSLSVIVHATSGIQLSQCLIPVDQFPCHCFIPCLTLKVANQSRRLSTIYRFEWCGICGRMKSGIVPQLSP